MKKFVIGLRYGNWQTRLYVISIPTCVLIGVGLIIASFFVNSMYLFLIGVAFGIGVIALILNYAIEEVTVERPEETDDRKVSAKKAVKLKRPEEPENLEEPAPPTPEPEKKAEEDPLKKELKPEKPKPEKPQKEKIKKEKTKKTKPQAEKPKAEKIEKEQPQAEQSEEEKKKKPDTAAHSSLPRNQ